MYFLSTTILLAFAMATGTMASPLTERAPNELVELFREDSTAGGQMIYYGHGNDVARDVPSLQERGSCPTTPTINCHTSNAARNDVCDNLMTDLYGYSNQSVGIAPRQICYMGNSESDAYCCVSWHDPINGLTKGDLAPTVEQIYKQCTTNGISGRTGKFMLDGICTNVCLSDRGNHC